MMLTKYRNTFYSEYVRNIAEEFEREKFCLIFMNGPQDIYIYFYPDLGPYSAERKKLSLWEEFLQELKELEKEVKKDEIV